MIAILILSQCFCHFSSSSKMLSFLYIPPPQGYFSFHIFAMEIYAFVSPHSLSLSLSLSVFPRAYLGVIWRMGLQHRGQGTWCSGCHCHGNLHHDTGPGATHYAKVKLPRDTWQKEFQYWPLQRNTEVSHYNWDVWQNTAGLGYMNANMGKLQMCMQNHT